MRPGTQGHAFGDGDRFILLFGGTLRRGDIGDGLRLSDDPPTCIPRVRWAGLYRRRANVVDAGVLPSSNRDGNFVSINHS